MTAPIPPTMKVRHDGSRYPADAAQSVVLADFSDETTSYVYERTLGDLIVDVLAGRPLTGDRHLDRAVEFESVEHAFLTSIARELRVMNLALASEHTDDPDVDLLDPRDVKLGLQSLARRVEAGAELCERLRRARWGHPSFGGGEVPAGPVSETESEPEAPNAPKVKP